ncbi:MAG: hypothetical protein ABFS46_02845, partial [Myxococcota bacterium]
MDRSGPREAEPGLSFEALEESYFLNGEWSRLVALYGRRLEAPAVRGDAPTKARLLFRLAQVLEERLEDVEAALERYLEAAQLDPSFRPALAQLRRLHARRGRFELALQVAEHEDALAMRPFERATFHTEVAALWAEHVGDPGQALEQYDRALTCAPGHELALRGRAQALVRLERADEAATVYGELLERARGSERATFGVALAALQEGPLQRENEAFESYRRALTHDPSSLEALEGLASLAGRCGRWPLLAELQERRFERAESPADRFDIALTAADLEVRRLERPAVAAGWFRRAMEIDASRVEPLLGLAELEALSGRSEAQARLLEAALALDAGSVPARGPLQLAQLAEAGGGRERAVALARTAQERAPDDPQVLDALAGHLERADLGEELALVLERQAALESADPPSAARRLRDLGRLHEERLADPEAALAAYRRALALDPELVEAGGSIEALLHKTGAFDALRAHLEHASEGGPVRDRPRALCALGDLLADVLDDPEAAGPCFERALALEAGHEAALRGLERLALAKGDEAAIVRVYEREANLTSDPARLAWLVCELVRILEAADRAEEALMWAERLLGASPDSADALAICARLHQRLGNPDEAASSLERLDPLLDTVERAANRQRLAELHRERGDDAAAVRFGLAALESEPGHVATLRALVGPLERSARLQELAEVYQQLADVDSGARIGWLGALAGLLDERLDEPDAAIEILRRLRAEAGAPEDADDRLETLLERRGRLEELVDHLEVRRARTRDASDALRIELRRAGLLLTRLGRAGEAAAAYRRVLDEDPSCGAADAGLEQSLRADRDSRGLVDLLRARAGRAQDPAARGRLLLEAARLLEEALERPDAARRAYAELADGAADGAVRSEAAEALEAVLERGGDWEALRARVESRLAGADETLAGALHERLAGLADRLGDRPAAARHLEETGRRAPQRSDVWRALGVLYESLERSVDVLRVHEAELATRPSSERELVLRARAGALYAGRADGAASAEAHYRRALELCPSHTEAVGFLSERFESEGRHAELARLLEARLDDLQDAEPDAPTDLALRLRIASLRGGALRDAEGAIAVLERGLRTTGAVAVIAEPLASLYEEAGHSERLIELCRARADAGEHPGERATWSMRLGAGLAVAGRSPEAIRAYHQALADRPGDREVCAALCHLYRQCGEAEPLARLLEAELALVMGSEEVARRLELADLLAERLDRAAEALPQLRRVLELDADHPVAFERGLAIAEQLGRHEDSLALLDARLRRIREPRQRAALEVRRGRLLAGPLERQDAGVEAYRRALQADPKAPSVVLELRRVLEAIGRFEDALDLVHVQLRFSEAAERSELLLHAADLAAAQVSLDASLPWLERLRSERGEDPALLERVSQVHRRGGRRGALLRSLEAELALGPEAQKRRALEGERAEILEGDLGLPLAAAHALEAAHTAAPDDGHVLRELARLYQLADRPRERAGALARLLERAEPAERNALRRELARLHLEALHEPEPACSWLEQILAQPEEGELPRAELLRDLGTALIAARQLSEAARVSERELLLLDPGDEVLAERRVELHQELATRYAAELANPGRELTHLRALVDG